MSTRMLLVFKIWLGEWKSRYSTIIVYDSFMTVIYFATCSPTSSLQVLYFTSFTAHNL